MSDKVKAWKIALEGHGHYWEGNAQNAVGYLEADTEDDRYEDVIGFNTAEVLERLEEMEEGESFTYYDFTVSCHMVDGDWLKNLPEFNGW